MITALIAAAVTMGPPSVSDYFPLVPGTKWDYTETGMALSNSYTDEVRAPEEIEGKMATPIVMVSKGKEIGRTYYRIEGDTVYMVAYSVKKPLSSPTPILKIADGRVKWEFTGEGQFINDPVPITMICESASKGKRNVFGQEVEIVEVKLNGIVGGNSGTSIKSNQVAYYAKGIGLIEMLSDNTVGSRKSKSQLKLVRFEAGKQE